MWNGGLVIVLVACTSKAPPPPAPTPSNDQPAPIVRVAADPAPAKPAAHPQPTKDELAAERAHMKAGWAAQKDRRWADAVIEFEAALKILDGDARALSELGWSAMNAGDYAKARTADDAAVHAALDRNIKAASFYNLGLVELKLGDNSGALWSFSSSLALRPNQTVEAELAKLGAKPVAAVPFCAAGKSGCYCAELIAFGALDKEDPDVCREGTSPIPGFHLYTIRIGNGVGDYLLDEHQQLVAHVSGGTDHTRHVSETKLVKAEVKTIGDHRVAWIETTDFQWTEFLEETSQSEENVALAATTICAIGDTKTPTTCPVRNAPTSLVQTIDRTAVADDGTPGAVKHTQSETDVAVTLVDDGTVTVKLVTGSADNVDPGVLGTHKLW